MKLNSPLRWLALILLAFLLQTAPAPAAEAKKDAQTVMNEMRLKKWTKDLTLTAEQQKKLQSILDEENLQIAKVDADTSVDLNQRRTKVSELRQATYAKIKPVLNPEQLEAFEKSLARSQPKKK